MSTVVAPTSVTASGATTATSGTSPYVNTRDGDDSWVLLAPSASGGATWRCQLPATTACRDVESVDALVEARFVDGTGQDPSPASDNAPSVSLQRWNAGLGLFQFLTLAERFAEHHSFTYVLDTVPLEANSFFDATFQTIVDELAAGNLYITLFQQWNGRNQYDIRITYAAVRFNCPGIPPLRQSQRDDIRASQLTSRQRSIRQNAYL
jgi:hypothetical protein